MSGRPGLARWAGKHLASPPLRLLLRLGIAPRAVALLETTGRRTGRRRLTPVGNGLDGDVFWLIAARGRRSSYAENLTARPRCGSRWAVAGTTALPDSSTRTMPSPAGLVGQLLPEGGIVPPGGGTCSEVDLTGS